jgi:hypothetical protein
MSTLTAQKHTVWIWNPRPHEAQLEDQKWKKSSRMSSRRRKNHKANKRHEKRQNQGRRKEKLKTKTERARNAQNHKNSKTPPETNSP